MSSRGGHPTTAPTAQLTAKTLHQLFLTLFLRGHSLRGSRRSAAPTSVGVKLAGTLVLYALVGLSALLLRDSVFELSVFLHSTTFVLVGMFVASSAGEVLFNQAEADILLHRPVPARILLWAKIRVLLEVSLWLAAALNLAGLFVGTLTVGGSWIFPFAHGFSIVLETLFFTSGVVLVYELCLRWFGRERLDALLTTTQVIVAVGGVLAGQIVPRLMRNLGGFDISLDSWWLGFLPPIWFAAFDEALAGARGVGSWLLAVWGLAATATLASVAFGKLAGGYGHGLQLLGEAGGSSQRRAARRWFDRLVNSPPLSWWLRDSETRAAFLLTAAYLVRDRDVKLRVYPALSPMLMMPVMFLLQAGGGRGHPFFVAMGASFLGLAPMMALSMLRFSQHWQASEIFRIAPLSGPAAIFRGARRAVFVVLTVPLLMLFAAIGGFARVPLQYLPLVLPGLMLMPLYPLYTCLHSSGVPLSRPSDEANAASRGLRLVVGMLVSLVVSAIGVGMQALGWLSWFLLVEAAAVAALCLGLRRTLRSVTWSAED